MDDVAAQDRWSPNGMCFGCGPANAKGLRIKSRWVGDDFVARFRPEAHHQAFQGILNGGIIGALLDCHGNWCAATTLLREKKLDEAPPTVTAEYTIKLKRPTPTDRELTLHARAVAVEGDKVTVEGELRADGVVTATCRGVFVAVKPGHPAYHRWS